MERLYLIFNNKHIQSYLLNNYLNLKAISTGVPIILFSQEVRDKVESVTDNLNFSFVSIEDDNDLKYVLEISKADNSEEVYRVSLTKPYIDANLLNYVCGLTVVECVNLAGFISNILDKVVKFNNIDDVITSIPPTSTIDLDKVNSSLTISGIEEAEIIVSSEDYEFIKLENRDCDRAVLYFNEALRPLILNEVELYVRNAIRGIENICDAVKIDVVVK